MSMRVATGPAWQVRESARQGLLERLRGRVCDLEEEIGALKPVEDGMIEPEKFYDILLHWLLKQLDPDPLPKLKGPTITIIPGWPRAHVNMFVRLQDEICGDIKKFERSPEEGKALLAELLVWCVGQIAHPYHRALEEQQFQKPDLIYGVERATDEVPFE